jgi:uncharacterized protein (TIGR03000 family)
MFMQRFRTLWLVVLLALLLGTRLPGPATAGEQAPPDKALLVVRLPAKATLTIAGDPTLQTGSERLFLSPPLVRGKTYSYELVATWNEGGKLKKTTRKAIVKAGQTTTVDFNKDEPPTGSNQKEKSRTFLFTYTATVTDLLPGKLARIWVPVPPSTPQQDVTIVSKGLPAEGKIEKDKLYGNKILYVEAKADKDGKIPLQITYKVTRREVKTAGGAKVFKPAEREELIERFLEPDAKVPITGKPLELIKGKDLPKDQVEVGKVLYDVVNHHMKYDKSKPGWGQGDAVWACDSKFGNCSDFHSLFISLARSQKIPAKFEMGFPIPPERGEGKVLGYHCWAWFLPEGKGWVPVDISEANRHPKITEYYFGNLTEDRVQFSTGRDIELVPPAAAGPRNFIIYPYVEVDGKTYPDNKVERSFTYKDVSG